MAKTEGDDDDASLRPRSFEIRPGRGTQLMMAGYRYSSFANFHVEVQKYVKYKSLKKKVQLGLVRAFIKQYVYCPF